MRRELRLADGEALLLHMSNLRPLKRIDLLLDTAARLKGRLPFKLVILAGGDFAPFRGEVARRGLENHVVVRERVEDIEDYVLAADVGLFTSEVESFCLSILELMSLGRPSAAFAVGGIPEVTVAGETGVLVPGGDTAALAAAVEALMREPARRAALGSAAQRRARERFSAAAIVPRYEALYRRVCPARP
jgi:glycosyltransferase involved in cell wall biosynthesis